MPTSPPGPPATPAGVSSARRGPALPGPSPVRLIVIDLWQRGVCSVGAHVEKSRDAIAPAHRLRPLCLPWYTAPSDNGQRNHGLPTSRSSSLSPLQSWGVRRGMWRELSPRALLALRNGGNVCARETRCSHDFAVYPIRERRACVGATTDYDKSEPWQGLHLTFSCIRIHWHTPAGKGAPIAQGNGLPDPRERAHTTTPRPRICIRTG